MGLDMYLYRRDKVFCPHCGKEITGVGEDEEVCYWRKANAIHRWFKDHCANNNLENLEDYPVTKDQLIELQNTCEKVLNSSKIVYKLVKERRYDCDIKDYREVDVCANVIDDPSVAEELLPTQSGYFFGGPMYDEHYIEDLKYTIRKIDEILEETDFEHSDITYRAWW